MTTAYEVLNRFSWTDEQIFIYAQEEKSERDLKAMIAAGIDEGEARGQAKGIELGEAKKQREIALKMIRRGLKNFEIAEDTGLSLEEIQILRNNQ